MLFVTRLVHRDLQKHINSSPTSQPNQEFEMEEIRVPEERVPTPEWESEYDGASDVPNCDFEMASFSPRGLVEVSSISSSDLFRWIEFYFLGRKLFRAFSRPRVHIFDHVVLRSGLLHFCVSYM